MEPAKYWAANVQDIQIESWCFVMSPLDENGQFMNQQLMITEQWELPLDAKHRVGGKLVNHMG